MKAQQVVETSVDVSVRFEADRVRDHYGVAGSPEWWAYENIEFAELTVDIAGVTVKLSELPLEFRDALFEAAYEYIDDFKWEME